MKDGRVQALRKVSEAGILFKVKTLLERCSRDVWTTRRWELCKLNSAVEHWRLLESLWTMCRDVQRAAPSPMIHVTNCGAAADECMLRQLLEEKSQKGNMVRELVE